MNTRLEVLRTTFARALLAALSGLAMVTVAVAWWRGLSLAVPITVMALTMMAPMTVVLLRRPAAALTRLMSAAALPGLVGLLVLGLHGSNLQIDMHMAFFAGLAIIAGWCCALAILASAGAIAVHHLVLNVLYPLAVFPDGADFGRVVLHAVIVVAETLVLAWLTQRLSSALTAADAATEEARAAQAISGEVAAEQERLAAAQSRRRADIDAMIADFRARSEAALTHMAARAREMRSVAGKLAGLSEQAVGETGSASSMAAQAAHSVQAVASAAEELSASIGEINDQVTRATNVVQTATADSDATNREVASLAHSAQEIGTVVELIRSIAGQTNLLALNATIEAARAGEAGKGFAVVASEVKSLATQTAQATEQISQQIAAVQLSSEAAVEAVGRIASRMQDINTFTAAIAAAIQQQGSATAEISGSVGVTAEGTSNVTATLDRVSRSADETAVGAKLVLAASDALETASSELKDEVARFLQGVAA
jgi:methyl-accepting chemotaxis protein